MAEARRQRLIALGGGAAALALSWLAVRKLRATLKQAEKEQALEGDDAFPRYEADVAVAVSRDAETPVRFSRVGIASDPPVTVMQVRRDEDVDQGALLLLQL